MAQVALYPLIHPRFGLLNPVSPTFKVISVPLAITFTATYEPHVRKMTNLMFGTQLPDKFSWRNKEHVRQFFIVFGLSNMLTQILIVPFMVPTSRPSPLYGKLTFTSPLKVPKIAFTLATLLLLPRLASHHIETVLNIKDEKVRTLTYEITLLGTFAGAVLLRDGATPLDLMIPGVLTYLCFALPQFDRLSKFLFQAEFPHFKFFNRDYILLGLTLYSTWLALTLSYGDYIPGLKQLNEAVRTMFSGNGDIRFVGKLIEFGLLYIIPTVVRRYSLQKDRETSMSAGFMVSLFIQQLLPSKR